MGGVGDHGGYQAAGFGYGPIFVSLIVAFLTAATVGPTPPGVA
jgi:hypothetical protein